MAISTLSSTQTAASALAPPPACRRQKMYDVFLSFRGEDTRRGIISHLFKELNDLPAIRTFKDDPDLQKGATISPELLNAIQQSHFAIVVISPNYASSTWCLDELSNILQCMQEEHHTNTNTNTILPIFYDVDPSDVRNQRGTFAQAFTEHQQKFGEEADNVKRWRAALREVANLSGWHSNNFKCDSDLIKDIVNCVWRKISPTFTMLDSQEKLVGIDLSKTNSSSNP